MWRRIFLAFSLAITHTSAHLDSNGTETAPRECCPCPPASDPGLALAPAPTAVCAGLPGLDRCPCLPRDADSEGSASVFFPNSVRPFGNVVRPKPKQDAKPLLHPEVDLASSMLETLREATEEEYRDALERDAARAATSDMDTVTLADIIPVENRNVVTIVVSPQDMDGGDDSMSQASHVHDTRCIHAPLGNARPSYDYQPQVSHKGLDDILNLPLPGGLIHKQRDNNVAASNVHESVVKNDNHLNKFLSGFRFKTGHGLLNSAPLNNAENINDNNHFKNGPNADVMSSDQRLSGKSNNAYSSAKESTSNVFDNQCLNNKDALDVSKSQLDSDPFPSNTQGQFVEATKREENNSKNPAVLPRFISKDLKNLHKLRDVELVPLDIRKIIPSSKLNIPDFKFGTFPNKPRESTLDPIRLPKLFDWLNKPSKISNKNNEEDNGTTNVEDIKKTAYVQKIPKKENVTTQILDALPSPSEPSKIVSSKDNCLTMQPQESDRVMKEDNQLLYSTSAESVESGPEIVSNSKAKNENDIDIADLDYVNDAIESISYEEPEISESNSIENIEIVNDTIDNQGLDQESNNKIISSQKEISDFCSSAVDLREINETKERNNKFLAKGHPPKNLENIRKSVIEKLDSVLIENVRDYISHKVKEKSSEESDTDDEGISLVEQVINSEEHPATELTSFTETDELPDVSATVEEVSYKDLQNMSDSLLQKSEKKLNAKEKKITLKEHQVEVTRKLESSEESKQENCDYKELSESEIDNVLGINKSGKSSNVDKGEVIEESPNASSLKKTSNTKTNEMVVPITTDKENCDHDLEPLASEPVINSILRPNSKSLIDHLSDFESRLRQNIIVQPKPLINTDDINIFKTPSLIPDISDLNTNIPTLEEIRNRVSEILGGLARHTVDEEVSSELDSDDFASNINPVLSTGGCTSDSNLSPLKPSKDINLDIVQLKPLLPLIPRVGPLRAELPGLNLNTYTAKLAIPDSLDITPLNLASTLSNDGGLVGATLSIGPKKYKNIGNIKSTLSTPEPISLRKLADVTSSMQNNARHFLTIPKTNRRPKLKASNNIKDIADNLKHHTESTIKNIHQSLNYPSFDDIHTNIKENSHNILSSSRNAMQSLQDMPPISNVVDNLKAQTENTMTHIQRSLYAPTLTDISATVQKHAQDLINSPTAIPGRDSLGYVFKPPLDLKPHSEKAVKDFQKTLKASLRKSPVKELPPLTDPKQVLQMISNHREDFNDKIFAIHTDLSDRLESMHNDIIDPERLKTIISPPNNRYFESFYIPLPSSSTRMLNANKPARPVLKTKQPSLVTQRKELRKSSVSQVSKPKSGTSKLSTMRASTGKERNSPKLSKLKSAGTAPTITRIDRPALPKMSNNPKLSKPLDSQSLKHPLLTADWQVVEKPLLPKYKPLTGLGPTTLRSNFTAPVATTKQITSSAKPKVSNNNRFKPKPIVRQQTPWSEWGGPKTIPKLSKLGDSRTSSSIDIPKLPASLRTKSASPINKSIKTAPLPSLGSLSSRIQPQPLLKTQPKFKIEPTPQGRASNPDLLSGPKKINSSFLSKLTEALKSRHSKANLSSSPDKSSLRLAMPPAASEKVEQVVALEEPIKENVSYKCKMMCVRTD